VAKVWQINTSLSPWVLGFQAGIKNQTCLDKSFVESYQVNNSSQLK